MIHDFLLCPGRFACYVMSVWILSHSSVCRKPPLLLVRDGGCNILIASAAHSLCWPHQCGGRPCHCWVGWGALRLPTRHPQGASQWVALWQKLSAMQETWVQLLGQEKTPGSGNGSPLQSSCLENPMDREAWWATVHGVPERQTRLSTHSLRPPRILPGQGERDTLVLMVVWLLLMLRGEGLITAGCKSWLPTQPSLMPPSWEGHHLVTAESGWKPRLPSEPLSWGRSGTMLSLGCSAVEWLSPESFLSS